MKKITFLLACLFVSSFTIAQVTLSNNTNDVVTTTNSVGCPNDNDNNWARNFDLSEYTIPSDFGLESGQIGIQEITSDAPVVVNVYSSTVPFDEASLVLLGTQSLIIPASLGAPAIFDYTFDAAVSIPNGTPAIFVEVSMPAATGSGFFIGGTAASLSGKESYLKSLGCTVPNYVTASSINFPDAHFFITVTGDTVLGLDTNVLSQISVYPNPASDILTIKVPSNVQVNNATLYDILGKNTGVVFANEQIDVSSLSRGVYILTVDTNEGSITQRIVKK